MTFFEQKNCCIAISDAICSRENFMSGPTANNILLKNLLTLAVHLHNDTALKLTFIYR